MTLLRVWLNEDRWWLVGPPIADAVWRQLGIRRATSVMAKDFVRAFRTATRSPPVELKSLLDEIEADYKTLMVRIER